MFLMFFRAETELARLGLADILLRASEILKSTFSLKKGSLLYIEMKSSSLSIWYWFSLAVFLMSSKLLAEEFDETRLDIFFGFLKILYTDSIALRIYNRLKESKWKY